MFDGSRRPCDEQTCSSAEIDFGSTDELERETRFELATSCLEGRRSTTELLPQRCRSRQDRVEYTRVCLSDPRADESRRPKLGPRSFAGVSIAGVNEPVIAAVIEPPVDDGCGIQGIASSGERGASLAR